MNKLIAPLLLFISSISFAQEERFVCISDKTIHTDFDDEITAYDIESRFLVSLSEGFKDFDDRDYFGSCEQHGASEGLFALFPFVRCSHYPDESSTVYGSAYFLTIFDKGSEYSFSYTLTSLYGTSVINGSCSRL